MKIKGLMDEDFLNYRKPCMHIAFPRCSFKCDREAGKKVCQNSILAKSPDIEIEAEEIVDRYMGNPLTHAILCCGLEPMDSFPELLDLLKEFRKKTEDDFVVYTGYEEEEIEGELRELSKFANVAVKFGRYRPGGESRMDPILGVKLAGRNQYAKKISQTETAEKRRDRDIPETARKRRKNDGSAKLTEKKETQEARR